MNRPNIEAIIKAKAEDAPVAEQFFGEEPTPKWRKAIKPGIDASQRVINEFWKNAGLDDIDLAGPGKLAAPPVAAPSLTSPTSPPQTASGAESKPAAFESGVDVDLLKELAARVNAPAGSSHQTIIEAILAGKWRRKAIMLTPLALPILPWVHFAHMACIRKQPWLGYMQETDTLVDVARNILANQFLASEAEWSFWVDGDIAPCYGDPAFFFDVRRLGWPAKIDKRWFQTPTLDRLVSAKQSIVGAVYQQRRRQGAICSPIEINRPKPLEVAAEVRNKGPVDKVISVDWCATGCLLVHRQVYLDIMAKRPDLAPKQKGGMWNFFCHEVGVQGEDAAFGALAKEAGHQSYLDLGAWVAHLGNYAFAPEGLIS